MQVYGGDRGERGSRREGKGYNTWTVYISQSIIYFPCPQVRIYTNIRLCCLPKSTIPHSRNYGVKITPPVLIEDYTMHFTPVLIEDYTMHVTPVLNYWCYFNTQCCYSNTFGCYFNTL